MEKIFAEFERFFKSVNLVRYFWSDDLMALNFWSNNQYCLPNMQDLIRHSPNYCCNNDRNNNIFNFFNKVELLLNQSMSSFLSNSFLFVLFAGIVWLTGRTDQNYLDIFFKSSTTSRLSQAQTVRQTGICIISSVTFGNKFVLIWPVNTPCIRVLQMREFSSLKPVHRLPEARLAFAI